MKTNVFTSIRVMGALGLLATLPAYALGLGKIELSSALNEPFHAEIPVNAINGDEAESLQVRLASNAEFERAGLVKNAAITQLKFDVIQKAGKTVIVVTSKNAVKEPLLDFLLLAKSSNGQLIREYTVLLDPPKNVFKQSARAAQLTPPPQRSQPVQSRVQTRESAPSLAGLSQYGPTSKTDTLWDIALKTRPTRDISVHQMMLALVEKNTTAFIKNNINGLKSGYTLTIPSTAEITQLTQQQARAVVNQQNTAWKNRNVAQKTVVESAPTTEIVEQEQISDETDEIKVEQDTVSSSTVTDAEPTARLQLVGSNDEKLLSENDLAAFGNEKVKTLSDQLTIAQEVIESQQQESVDMKARLTAMEEQIQTLRKLISLQDPDLARLQSKLEQDSGNNELDTLKNMSEALQNSLLGNEVVTSPTESTALDADNNEVETISNDVVTKPPQLEGDKPEVVTPITMEDVSRSESEPTTTLEKIQNFLLEHKMTALLAGLAFLLGLLLLNRKKSESGRKTWDEAIDNINKQKPEAVSPAIVVPPLIPVDHDAEIETNYEPVKTVDDLLNDADVYVSYGNFDKAEQVLTEAYNDDPSNLLVLQKLLFSYYKQAKSTAFVELAREYLVERDSMEWAEVATWGREIAPGNALFDEPTLVEEPVAETTESAGGMDFDLSPDDDDESLMKSEAVQNDETPADDDDLLAFTIDVDVDETAISDKVDGEERTADLSDSTPADNTLSFSEASDELEFEGLDTLSENELEEATQALADSHDDLAFDLSDFDAVDETETKLDLASAYIEMGDSEGAKNILQEVINEGSDEQQARAEALLNDL